MEYYCIVSSEHLKHFDHLFTFTLHVIEMKSGVAVFLTVNHFPPSLSIYLYIYSR